MTARLVEYLLKFIALKVWGSLLILLVFNCHRAMDEAAIVLMGCQHN
ncbi:hypothetical protein JOY44_26360 (plasmid) [Phormidium sp. CLA17]|nr:hypothetical protein [Leptolyngbya sp. Cla-17]MBM0745044.1 hypothetical protein [Leptolyngbya sp. Cla-17]